MNVLEKVPYKLGSTFEENNVSLELLKEFNPKSKYYTSYRHSELYLFGRAFQVVCYLHFWKGCLNTIFYKLHKDHFDLFRDSINGDLPEHKQLVRDLNNERFALESFFEGIAIGLIQQDDNHFFLKISKNPSLPRIKSNQINR